jgi:hypothetical protein
MPSSSAVTQALDRVLAQSSAGALRERRRTPAATTPDHVIMARCQRRRQRETFGILRVRGGGIRRSLPRHRIRAKRVESSGSTMVDVAPPPHHPA